MRKKGTRTRKIGKRWTRNRRAERGLEEQDKNEQKSREENIDDEDKKDEK